MARRPRLSAEDRALWSRVAESVEPLKQRRRKAPSETLPAEPDQESPSGPEKPHGKAQASRPRPSTPRPAPASIASTPKPPFLQAGGLVDIDRRNAERLRRGRLPIEGVLDLHGLRQHEAEEALARFLAAGQAAGKRCVLVITGKGRWGSEAGILRQRLGEWLNGAPNRARVLAFSAAQPKHGGHGAFYVLLKRLRV